MANHSLDAQFKKAQKLVKKGNFEGATEQLEKLREIYPENIRITKALNDLENTKNNRKIQEIDLDTLQRLFNEDKLDEAITEADNILAISPNLQEVINLKGACLGKQKKFDLAKSCFEKSIQVDANHASSWSNLGTILKATGDKEAALNHYMRALSLEPKHYDALKNTGYLLSQMGNKNQAYENFHRALEIRPDDPEMLNQIGIMLAADDNFEEARGFYETALKYKPNFLPALNNLGNVYLNDKKFEKAISFYEKAIEIDPNYADALNNIGNALKELAYLDEAIHYYERAIEAKPLKPELHSNFGVALKDRGKFIEAHKAFDKAIELRPGYADAYWNKSLAYLTEKKFDEGWGLYDWRWKATNFDSTYLPTQKPLWNGNEETVLVWPEQGIGDQIMFSTLFEEFAEKVKNAIFQVDWRLLPIFRSSFPELMFIPNDKFLDENAYDSHLPMGSLAKLFRSSEENFENKRLSFLKSDTNKKRAIRQAFRVGDKRLIGISWKSANVSTGKARSIELTQLLSNLRINNAEFVNLQYGDTKEEIQKAYQDTGIAVHSVNEIDTLKDISNLANLIDACDTVVTIDNTTVHLAASLGKKTHLLVPFVTDWRWFNDHHKSIWYKDLFIYRKEFGADWKNAIDKLNIAIS